MDNQEFIIEKTELYPELWAVGVSVINAVGSFIGLIMLAEFCGAPLTLKLLAMILVTAVWFIFGGWWEHYRILGFSDEALSIDCFFGYRFSFRWSELNRVFIYHHRGIITQSYDLLEFPDKDGFKVQYYLSDLGKNERRIALAVLREKLPGLREIH